VGVTDRVFPWCVVVRVSGMRGTARVMIGVAQLVGVPVTVKMDRAARFVAGPRSSVSAIENGEPGRADARAYHPFDAKVEIVERKAAQCAPERVDGQACIQEGAEDHVA
jgi:hypothetical protein